MSTTTTSVPQEPSPVIAPARTRFRVERGGAALELRRRGMGLVAVPFLILWLTGWTAGCVLLAYKLATDPSVFFAVFATPFFASWFAVAGYIAYGLFGVETLHLDRSGARLAKRVGPWGYSHRHVPLAELRRAEVFKTSYEVNEQPVFGVRIRTIGQPLDVAGGVETDEREWLIDLLNREMSALGVAVVSDNDAGDKRLAAATTIPSSAVSAAPPSDNRWEMTPGAAGVGSVELLRRGRFSLQGFVGITFINLFWNGIVAVFVMHLWGVAPTGDSAPPRGGEWWFLFWFLVPFEVIGLVLLIVWVAVLTAPAWLERLTLERHEIARRFSIFDVGRTRRIPAAELGDLSVRHRPSRNRGTVGRPTGAGEWELVLADRARREVLRLWELTEGEAHWLAATIRRTYPRAFKPVAA